MLDFSQLVLEEIELAHDFFQFTWCFTLRNLSSGYERVELSSLVAGYDIDVHVDQLFGA